MNDAKDKDIIDAIVAGEIDQFEEIMKRYNDQFYRIAISFIKDPFETEDAMQSAYLKIYEHLPSFKHESGFSTWAIRILINECKMLLRKKRTARQMLTQFTDNFKRKMTHRTSESALINGELKTFMESAIMELPTKYRSVFIFREINGFSTKETAELLEISESNIKVRLHRAKEQVKTKMLKANKENALFDFHLSRCQPLRSRVMHLIRTASGLV